MGAGLGILIRPPFLLAFFRRNDIPAVAKAKPEIDREALEMSFADPWFWAYSKRLKLGNYTFGLRGWEYLVEPMQSKARRICVRKGTQGGFTVSVGVIVAMHGMIHGRFPLGVGYIFPSRDDVTEFSRARFSPLISDNPMTVGKYVRETNTTEIKKVGNSFLYLRGARLNQYVRQGARESSRLRSFSCDMLIFDELDLMSDEVMGKLRGRYGKSPLKWERALSNPTLPDVGVDALFQESDQRYWHRKCSKCNDWTCAELEFPECVCERSDRTGYIACKRCGAELDIAPGEWVPAETKWSDYRHGYHWSQLTSPTDDPAEILRNFNDPPEGNMADVMRMRLGLPYIEAENRLTVQQVYACCGADANLSASTERCAMGVDVGSDKLHYAIGRKLSKNNYVVLSVGVVRDWNELHDVASRFNLCSAVVDSMPEMHAARDFQKAEPYRVSLCQYSEHMNGTPEWNLQTGIVKVNRTELCDRVHELFAECQVQIPRRCSVIDVFARQMTGTAKSIVTDDVTGLSKCRYIKLKADHFFHVMVYLYLAMYRMASISGQKPGKGSRTLSTKNDYYF